MHIYSIKCYLFCFLSLFLEVVQKIWRVALANSFVPSQLNPPGATL